MNKIIGVVLVLLVIIVAGYLLFADEVTDRQPGPVATTTTSTTTTSTPELLPRVSVPVANTVVTSPLRVMGQAPGPWFFEANLPIRLVDANGRELALAPAQASGNWMTTDYVPFSGTLNFAAPTTTTGFLIINNDNPSGLPENNKEYRVPVRFNS